MPPKLTLSRRGDTLPPLPSVGCPDAWHWQEPPRHLSKPLERWRWMSRDGAFRLTQHGNRDSLTLLLEWGGRHWPQHRSWIRCKHRDETYPWVANYEVVDDRITVQICPSRAFHGDKWSVIRWTSGQRPDEGEVLLDNVSIVTAAAEVERHFQVLP